MNCNTVCVEITVPLSEVLAVNRPTLPSHNTYRRVLGGAIEQAELQAIVTEHLTQPSGAGQSVLVALERRKARAYLLNNTGQSQTNVILIFFQC